LALSRSHSTLSIVAVCAALALLFCRVLFLGLAPFIHDEPKFLLAAWAQIETGVLADHSPLAGSGPLRYGPTPLWFFALVQLLIGKHARTVIGAVGLVTCLCQLTFALALHARGRTRAHSHWALAGVLLVAASSPYEFFWSRLAWDLITNFGPFLALALLASDDFGPLKGVLLGSVLGVCISAHPMVTPFAIAVFGVLLISRFGPLMHRALTLLAAGAAVVVVNLPWLNYLRHAEQLVVPGQQNVGWSFTAQRFLETYRPHSIWGLAYFFDDDWNAFSTTYSWITQPNLQTASLALCAIVTISGLLALVLQRGEPGLTRVGLTGILCAIGYPIFFSRLQLENHPHYQFPVVWLTVAAAAGLFYSRSRWLIPLRVLAVLLAVSNIAFTASWGDFIWKRTGTRGIHYGTPVAEQTKFVRDVCASRGTTVHVINQTAMFPYPLEQHFKSEAKCRGKKLDLCGENRCRNVPATESVIQLGYRDPEGGALRWDVVSSR
jgi:hypothetical protein